MTTRRTMTFAAVAVAAGALALIAFVGTGALPPVTGPAANAASTMTVDAESDRVATADRAGAPGARAAVAVADDPAPEAGATILVTALEGDAQTPVPELPLRLMPLGGRSRGTVAATDADGRVTFQGVPPGSHVVRANRADARVVHVSADGPSHHEVELVLADYADVVGHVVDLRGRGVAGANIWVAELDGDDARIAARSRDDGSFRCAVHSPRPTLWATVPGRVASAVLTPECFTGPPVTMDLVVGDRGAALTGRVLAADGRPVADALVEVRDVRPPPASGASVSIGLAGLRRTRTDALGGFALEDLGEGPARWRVRAPGMAGTGGVVQLLVERPRELTIDLPQGAIVAGTVVGLDGAPCADVLVRSSRDAGNGVRSAEDGSFRIPGLAPGSHELVASHPEHGSGSLPIELGAGETRAAELRLDPLGVVAGRVVDADGRGVPGLLVGAEPRPSWLSATVLTDGEGRFRFSGCREPLHRVWVGDTVGSARPPLAEAFDVAPDRGELELAIPAGADGRILARVRRPTGFEDAPVQVRISRPGQHGWEHRIGAAADGHVASGPLPPGEYQLDVVPWGSELESLAPRVVTVEPDRDVDVGELPLATPTALRVRAAREDGASVRVLDLELRRETVGRGAQSLRWRAGRFVELPVLEPGRHVLVARPGIDHLGGATAFEVVAGRVHVVDLTLAPARTCRIDAVTATGAPLAASVRALIERLDTAEDPRTCSLHDGVGRIGLAPGRYRATVSTPEVHGSAEFAVDRADGPELRVTLRVTAR